jgi:hypothetical protein
MTSLRGSTAGAAAHETTTAMPPEAFVRLLYIDTILCRVDGNW